MNIPRYWRRGSVTFPDDWDPGETFECFGSSDHSEDAAQRDADARARRIAESMVSGDFPDSYEYLDWPMREEIIRELDGETAIISRNSYGSLILNTAGVMFLDLDDPEPESAADLLIRRFLSRAPAKQTELEVIHQIAAQYPELSFRIYRTLRGYRGVVTNRTFDPLSNESEDLMNVFGCDPMFVRLCRAQRCYRARLTAKPWRCGISRPPVRFPFANPEDLQLFRDWEETYHAAADQYAACYFIEQIGSAGPAAEIQPILALHDELACLDGTELA